MRISGGHLGRSVLCAVYACRDVCVHVYVCACGFVCICVLCVDGWIFLNMFCAMCVPMSICWVCVCIEFVYVHLCMYICQCVGICMCAYPCICYVYVKCTCV